MLALYMTYEPVILNSSSKKITAGATPYTINAS